MVRQHPHWPVGHSTSQLQVLLSKEDKGLDNELSNTLQLSTQRDHKGYWQTATANSTQCRTVAQHELGQFDSFLAVSCCPSSSGHRTTLHTKQLHIASLWFNWTVSN